MTDDDEISTWIAHLKQGDARSHQEIWNVYFNKLVAMARGKLLGARLRDFDEEDIALSSLNSLFRAIDEQRVPKLDDQHDLWKLLVVITARKIAAQIRRGGAAKRGGNRVRGESIFVSAERPDGPGIEQVLGREPSPEMALGTSETFEELMSQLNDDTLRTVAQLKFEGYSNAEIAEQLDCVERTVARKVERIRALWGQPIG